VLRVIVLEKHVHVLDVIAVQWVHGKDQNLKTKKKILQKQVIKLKNVKPAVAYVS
jgi:hypothetical protein